MNYFVATWSFNLQVRNSCVNVHLVWSLDWRSGRTTSQTFTDLTVRLTPAVAKSLTRTVMLKNLKLNFTAGCSSTPAVFRSNSEKPSVFPEAPSHRKWTRLGFLYLEYTKILSVKQTLDNSPRNIMLLTRSLE